MKRTTNGRLVASLVCCGLWLAACDSAVSPVSQQLEASGAEELVSETMVSDATAMSDRPDFMTDVPNRDRVCRISDRTIGAGEAMLQTADDLSAYLVAKYPASASAGIAPGFAHASEIVLAQLVGPASCRQVVRAFINLAREGYALGGAIHREGLIRRDDRLGVLVRQAHRSFVALIEALRHDLSSQAARDAAVSDRP